tara:strand:- start:3736 stop:4014 length:279 start_codon:yes stop_codon:yes gene_type:complete
MSKLNWEVNKVGRTSTNGWNGLVDGKIKYRIGYRITDRRYRWDDPDAPKIWSVVKIGTSNVGSSRVDSGLFEADSSDKCFDWFDSMGIADWY